MAPQLVEKFWSDVQRRLTDDHKMTMPIARKMIRAYKHRLSMHRVGDAVFNRGEEAAVFAILNAVKNGFPEPELLQK